MISSRPPLLATLDNPLEVGKLLEGERLNQFELQQFVGGGGMGAVFRALDTTLNREVAVKVLSRGQSADEETLRRFQNEAQSAARLDHDNIARVYYVGEDRGVHYIVFEFIEGVNIRDLVDQSGPLPLAEAISYTLQLSEALAHASFRDVIHRDIKPSNVLITPDGKAKLVDMGLARLHQVEHGEGDLTASGVTLGTFDYISPEQARDPRSADVRSDLYSLGCSLYFMLTGRPPFADGTAVQKLLQHQGDEPPDPRAFRPDLPPELSRILGKLLAKNPQKRHQQPADLIEDLLILSEQIGLPQAVSSTSLVRQPSADSKVFSWQRHIPWMVPLGALIVIAAALDLQWSRSDAGVANPLVPQANNPTDAGAKRTHMAPPLVGDSAAGSNGLQIEDASSDPASVTASDDVGNSPRDATGQQGVGGNPTDAELKQLATWISSLASRVEQLRAGASAVARSAAHLKPLGPAARQALGIRPGRRSPDAQRLSSSAGRSGLLVVSLMDEGPHSYTTLQAAVNAAQTGDIIELHYNGRHEERPVTLANTRLRVRAGAGYAPIVAFRPTDADATVYPRSMLTVTGGQLVLTGLHLELDVPAHLSAESWALIETRQAELIHLEDCSLTIRNAVNGQVAAHPAVAFFDLKAPPGSEMMSMDPSPPESTPVAIDLRNCIVRGEATLVRTSETESLKLTWDNGALFTSERFLVAGVTPLSPQRGATVRINVSHVTAIMNSGLALLSSSQDTYSRLGVDLNWTDCIVRTATAAPLIEQRGPGRVEEMRSTLKWNGERNFYEGCEVFWRISSLASMTSVQQYGFSEWKAFWTESGESLPRRDAVVWNDLPSSTKPFHAQKPRDYALVESAANPARDSAADGTNAGASAENLPELPDGLVGGDASARQ